MGAENRTAFRKIVDPVHIQELTSLDNYRIIADTATIIDASTSGLLIEIDREHIVDKGLRANLSLDCLLGQNVAMFLPQMNLDLDGSITRTKHVGKGSFQVAIEFSNEVPDYWRECLIDLLPEPGEI